MRVAWFSPMPPVRSGIAACSAELVAALRAQPAISAVDVFVDEPVAAANAARPFGSRLSLAASRDPLRPDRLPARQLVASRLPLAVPVSLPGPDGAARRASASCARGGAAPHAARRGLPRGVRRQSSGSPPEAAELAVAGFDSHLYYIWPMTRLVVQASKLSAVHSREHGRPLAQRRRHRADRVPFDSATGTLSRRTRTGGRRDVRAHYQIAATR